MDRLPPLRLLETFDAVCRLGSMQRAAQLLNVSPPAISQAVRSLEQEIGTDLMDRSAKPAIPTEAGERLARATRNGLSLIEDTIVEIREEAGLSETLITLCCTIGMATQWLMPRLSGFYDRHPEITVNIQAPPSDRPILSRGTDIALRYGRGDWKDGTTVKLFDEVVCPVGRPDVVDRALDRGPLNTAYLIEVRSGGGPRWESWADYFKGQGLSRAPRPSETFDNYVQAVQATLNGRGIMLGWRSITQRLVDDGSFKKWPAGTYDFGTGYYLSYSASSSTKEATQKFLDWAVNEADTQL